MTWPSEDLAETPAEPLLWIERPKRRQRLTLVTRGTRAVVHTRRRRTTSRHVDRDRRETDRRRTRRARVHRGAQHQAVPPHLTRREQKSSRRPPRLADAHARHRREGREDLHRRRDRLRDRPPQARGVQGIQGDRPSPDAQPARSRPTCAAAHRRVLQGHHGHHPTRALALDRRSEIRRRVLRGSPIRRHTDRVRDTERAVHDRTRRRRSRASRTRARPQTSSQRIHRQGSFLFIFPYRQFN